MYFKDFLIKLIYLSKTLCSFVGRDKLNNSTIQQSIYSGWVFILLINLKCWIYQVFKPKMYWIVY